MLNISKLRSFEDERFYSVLDVALDIRGELDFGINEMEIPIMRYLPRFSILLPAATPSMMNRYCDLRWKALKFLEAEGYVSGVHHIDGFGISNWEDRVGLNVSDSSNFYEAAVLLSEEGERREPNNVAQDLPSAMVRVEQLCNTFHSVALRLRSRRGQRPAFVVEDEYDVQDLLGALLETRFADIRPEEWTPSHAGKSARMDFLLKDEQVVVETKMTRDGLTDGKLGEELILDIARYKENPDCRALFCFVYDPGHRLKNPAAIESDLSRKTDGLSVRVRVRPKR